MIKQGINSEASVTNSMYPLVKNILLSFKVGSLRRLKYFMKNKQHTLDNPGRKKT